MVSKSTAVATPKHFYVEESELPGAAPPTASRGQRSVAAANPRQTEPPKPLTEAEGKFIGELEKVWLPHSIKDLEVRYELGTLLNIEFGEPPALQPRGVHVLERAAERLDIATSDLSRMRAFAKHFKTFEEFKQKHPEIRGWSGVKRLIVALNNPDAPANSSSKRSVKADKKMLFGALTTLIETLESVQDSLTVAELADISKRADVLIGMVEVLTKPVQKPSRPDRDGPA